MGHELRGFSIRVFVYVALCCSNTSITIVCCQAVVLVVVVRNN